MSGIDDGVVSMKFDNEEFESKLSATIQSLDKLRESLDFANSTRGISELEDVANGFSLAGMGDSIDNISEKFSLLGAIGFTAIQTVTNAVLDICKKTCGNCFRPASCGW